MSRVFIHHVRACGNCAIGMKKYLIDSGMTQKQAQDFFKNGMLISEFEERFGSDPLARNVIERAKLDGEKEKTDGRL